uniref:F-box domain-containing protein n=1 Tax=Rhabditophanes sp. KR3021 TaxID=114890 RepID=A0AC35UC44_9BILA
MENHPFTTALSQAHIFKACKIQDFTLILNLAKTCKNNVLPLNDLMTSRCEVSVPYVIGQKSKTIILYSNEKVRGYFLNIEFDSKQELHQIINILPDEYFSELFLFNLSLDIKFKGKKGKEEIAEITRLLQMSLDRAHNLTKIRMSLGFQFDNDAESYEWLNFLEIFNQIHSQTVAQIELRCRHPSDLKNFFINLKESLIEKNYKKLEKFIIVLEEIKDLGEELNLDYQNETDYIELFEVLNASNFGIFEIHFEALTFTFFDMVRKLKENTKNNCRQIKIIVLPDYQCNLDEYDEVTWCQEQFISKWVQLSLYTVYIYLSTPQTRSFLKYVRRLYVTYDNNDPSILSLTDNHEIKQNFRCFENLKMFSFTSFPTSKYFTVVTRQLIFSLPPTITILHIMLPFDDSKEQLIPQLFPNLKELKLGKYAFSSKLKKCFFTNFKFLTILHLDCIGKLVFIFPETVRLLVFTCNAHKLIGTLEESLEIPSVSETLAQIHDYTNSLKSSKNIKLGENDTCECYKSKEQFKKLVVKRCCHSETYISIHFNYLLDWDLYVRWIQRVDPLKPRRMGEICSLVL